MECIISGFAGIGKLGIIHDVKTLLIKMALDNLCGFGITGN